MNKFLLFASVLIFFGCQPKPQAPFVQDQPLDSILHAFRQFNHDKILGMQDVGANDKSAFSLDFYFDTNDSMKAQHLAGALEKLNNHVNRVHRSSRDEMLWVLSGSSNPVSMDEESLSAWTDSMCRIGFRFDCGFLGWNPVSE